VAISILYLRHRCDFGIGLRDDTCIITILVSLAVNQ
jgi:hypothetical protein